MGNHWAQTRAHERAPPPVPDDHDEAVDRTADKEDEENQPVAVWVATPREVSSASSVPRTNGTTRRPDTPATASHGSHGSHGGSSLSSLGSSQRSSYRRHGHSPFPHANDDDEDEGEDEGDDTVNVALPE